MPTHRYIVEDSETIAHRIEELTKERRSIHCSSEREIEITKKIKELRNHEQRPDSHRRTGS
jgi:hypothetical protein